MNTQARVLIVDDNDASRFAKVQTLARAGLQVVEARTGAEALESTARDRPSLVVLDVNLPDINGMEVCRRVKESGGTPTVQVLHVSQTATSEEERVRGLNGGADMYLVEPVSAPILVATVRALLRIRQIEEDLERALQSERLAREEAQRANRTKDEFLAMVSHELRTPLNAMTGWIWQLKRGDLDPEAYQRAIDVLDRNARIQVQLINDLLDVSRISSGQLEMRFEPLDLRDVVAAAVGASADSLMHRRKRITLDLRTESAMVTGDVARLQQVLTNILNNAYQFTPAAGSIVVASGMENGQAFVRVRDSGSGIDPEFLPHVFERFRQERNLAISREPGLGLGLAIVRDLVDRHGGTVTLESEGIGRGTTVTVFLPPLEPGVSNHDHEAKISPALLEGLRLLVVEDDADAREILQAILCRYGAAVIVADCGMAAESRVRESAFDVLVSDIGLPDLSGFDLIKRLRGLGWTTPVVAVTAFATEVDRQRLLGEGFAAHVAKPVDPHALVQAVWLASRVATA